MNYGKAKAVADKIGISQVYSDYNEMFDSSGCDAVAVVTPDFAHTEVAIAAANHKKHVLVEKPLATKREDVFNMLDAFEKNNIRAMVDLHNRWSPPFNVAHRQ